MASEKVPVPGVLPAGWDEWIRQLAAGETLTFYPDQAQGGAVVVRTLGELITYLESLGWVAVYEMRNVLVGFMWAGGADPANTTDIAIRTGTEIVVGTGGTVTSFIASGKKGMAMIGKVAAVSAVMMLLASTIAAGGVATATQEDLITSADPYTIDGEHIPVIIDENGNIHYERDFIDAIRAKAIELGMFDSGDFSGDTTEIPVGTTFTANFTISECLDELWDAAVQIGVVNNAFTAAELEQYKSAFKDFISGVETPASSSGYSYRGNFSNFLGFHVGGIIRTSSNALLMPGDTYTLNNTYTVDGITYPVGSAYPPLLKYSTPSVVAYNFVSGSNISGTPGVTYGSATTSGIKFGTMSISTNNYKLSFYLPYNSYTTYRNGVEINTQTQTVEQATDTSNINIYRVFPYYAKTRMIGGWYLNGTVGSGGIEGIETNPDTKDYLSDLTKSLEEIFGVSGLKIASPLENDLENQTDWFPVNTTKDDVFIEGADSTETDPSVMVDGDVGDDIKDQIIEELLDMIEELLDSWPTIPTDDSGDTPPAQPPLISGSANGLWKVYNPTLAEIHAFGAWMWDSNIIEQITRMFNSPIDSVIALHQIYCTPVRGSAANIMCGYLDSGQQSTYTVANQYQDIDCGTVEITEYYRTAVDYTLTRIAIYLPFVGIVPLDASVVMGSTLQVIYRIDVLTGTCLAQIKVIKPNSNAVLYAFEGNCACQIPLTASTYTGMVGTLINGVQAGLSFAVGDIASGALELGQAVGSAVSNRTGMKQSGTFGANAGALGIRKPYVIITHPTIYEALAYNQQYGYPSNKLISLEDCSGYTRVKDIHLHDITCTDDELEMIETLLKEGVVIN